MLYDPTGEGLLAQKGELYLTEELMTLPQLIADRQARFDTTDRHYQYHLAAASIDALSQPLFKGKDETLHAASNDTERKLVIDIACVDNPSVISARRERELALRELQLMKNRFEAARLMVQLLCRGNAK